MCEKKIFAVDLDNTLIYSDARSRHLADRVCVEWRGEEELSYMDRRCLERLRRLADRLAVVPVTTRSLEQYRRIRFFPDREPELALAANGGILLEEGSVCEAWLAETRRLTAACAGQLEQAAVWLEEDPERCFELRRVNGLFLYTKTKKPERTAARLREGLDGSLVSVVENLSKIYVLPRCLTKGLAIRRLRRFLEEKGRPGPCPAILAAGDSNFDISMLAEADWGISVDETVMVEALGAKDSIRFWSLQEGQNRMEYTDFVLEEGEKFAGSQAASSFLR